MSSDNAHEFSCRCYECSTCGKQYDLDESDYHIELQCECGNREILTNGNTFIPNKKKTKGNIFTLFVLCLSIAFSMVGIQVLKDYTKSYFVEKEIENTLIEAYDDMKLDFPVLVDKNTQLDKVNIVGKNIIYSYTLTDLPQNSLSIKALLNERKNRTIGIFLSDPKIMKLLKSNITYTYKYITENKTNIGEFTITKKDCNL